MPNSPSFFARQVLSRTLVLGALLLVLPVSIVALWLLGGGVTHSHAAAAGFVLLVALVAAVLLAWWGYRGLQANDRAARRELEVLRGMARASDNRAASIIGSAMDAVVVTDAARQIVIFNAAAEQLFGYPAVDIVGRSIDVLLPERFRAGHESDMNRFAQTGNTNRRMGAGEVWARHADGHDIPVEVSISKTIVDDEPAYTAILRDITERKRAEAAMARLQRLYAALLHSGQAMARSADRAELFARMCEVAVREGGFAGCWIGLVEAGRLAPVAQSGMSEEYMAALDIPLDEHDPRSQGPSGVAVRTGAPYVCNRFIEDPCTQPWRALAAMVHIRASAAFPFQCGGTVVGTLNVYAAESDFFTPDMVVLLGEMASDISFALDSLEQRALREEAEGILRQGYDDLGRRLRARTTELFETNEQLRSEIAERTRTEEALRRSDARFNEAQRVGRVGSWELSLTTNELVWSDEIFRIFEVDPTRFAASYEAFLGTVHPEDRDLVNAAYTESVARHQSYDIAHRLLMPDGRVKHVRERGETHYDELGQPLRSIGTVQEVTAQVLADQEIRRTHDLLQAILDSTPDWIFVKDVNFRFLLVNKGFASALGLEPADMVGRLDSEFHSWEMCEGDPVAGTRGFHHDDRAALAGALVHNPRDIATDENGEVRVFDTLKGPLRDAGGKIYGVLGYARDVTDRSQAEHEIRELNESLERRVAARTNELEVERAFMQTVLDSAGTLIWVIDPQGRVIRANRALCHAVGMTPDGMIGQPIIDLLVEPALRPALHERLAQLVKTGETDVREVPIRGPGRAQRVVDWTVQPLCDASGAVEYLVGAGMDVTERRAAEIALRENEQLLREVADNMHQVIFVRDVRRDEMIFVSPAYETIWGRPRTTLYQDSRAFLDAVHPEDKAAVLAGLQEQEQQKALFNQEYRVVRPDGSERWVWVRAFPIADDEGTIYRMAGLVEDITERREVEESRFEHMRVQRDILVREVHHRIKNNLQGVAGLLRNHITRTPAARDVLENVITQIHTVALVHGLQGRSGSGDIRLCDVVQAISEAIESLTGVVIARDLPALYTPQCAHVAPDEAVPVSLIVNELIFNAVKHRRADTGVRVEVTLAPDVAHITIVNQADPLPAGFSLAEGKGLGTGLTLVRSLMPPRASDLEYHYNEGGISAILTLRAPVVAVHV